MARNVSDDSLYAGVSLDKVSVGIVPRLDRIGELDRAIFNALLAAGSRPAYVTEDSLAQSDYPDLFLICENMGPLWPVYRELQNSKVKTPVIIWNTEPLPNPNISPWLLGVASDLRFALEGLFWRFRWTRGFSRMAGRLRVLGEARALQRKGRLGFVAVFTARQQAVYRSLGLPAETVCMGVYPDVIGHEAHVRDIDVLFLGSLRDRRRSSIVEQLRSSLERRGKRFVIRDGSRDRGSAYGPERLNLLNRSKLFLNIMRQPWDDPVFRMLLAAPNGAAVISETVLDAGPFEAGTHFVEAPLTELESSILRYLDDSDARERIADAASAFTRECLTMERAVCKLLQCARARGLI